MQIQPELKSVLKRLRLSGILATLPDRWAYARQEKMDYPQFLELVLSDEVERVVITNTSESGRRL